MQKLRRLMAFFFIAIMAVIFPVQSVMAAFQEIKCDNAGNSTGGIFDPKIVYDPPAASVDPANPCGQASVDNIFTSIGCNYVLILNDVFSKFFCALQFGMRDLVVMIIVLYLVIYGIRLLMGTQEATGGATILALIKIGVVYMFVDKGTEAVSILYNFFVAFIEGTVSWVFSGINCPFIICLNGGDVADVFGDVDVKIKSIITGVDASGNPSTGLFNNDGEVVMFFFALLAISIPLFFIAFSLVKMIVSVFVRSLVTFMLSITAVAFLISLSPIFMSFMLFNSTYSLFDNWLRFLVSYSLQPMIIFAVFALWMIISADFLVFIGDITKIMIALPNQSKDKATILTINDTLAFCPLYYSDDNPSVNITSFPFTYTMGGPRVRCCELEYMPPLLQPVCKNTPPATNITPEQYLLDVDPYNRQQLLAPEALVREERFIYYLGYHFIALFAIASAFSQLVNMTPQIAQALSRSQAIMPLGAGFRDSGGGLSSMISSLTDGARRRVGSTANSISQRIVKMSTQR